MEWVKAMNENKAWEALARRTPVRHSHRANSLKYHAQGKASFLCSICENRWTSLKGQVDMEYGLVNTDEGLFGMVSITRLYGQACRACDDDFEEPKFNFKEADRILTQL